MIINKDGDNGGGQSVTLQRWRWWWWWWWRLWWYQWWPRIIILAISWQVVELGGIQALITLSLIDSVHIRVSISTALCWSWWIYRLCVYTVPTSGIALRILFAVDTLSVGFVRDVSLALLLVYSNYPAANKLFKNEVITEVRWGLNSHSNCLKMRLLLKYDEH